MLGGHGQNYFNEVVAFGIGSIPIVLLAFFLVGSMLENWLRGKTTAIVPRARALHFVLARVPANRNGWQR